MNKIFKDICWIAENGFDDSGASMLPLRMNDMYGINVLFKSTSNPYKNTDGIDIYTSYYDLYDKVRKLKPKVLFFVLPLFNDRTRKELANFVSTLFLLRRKLDCKIIMIDCSRRGVLLSGRDSLDKLEDLEQNVIKERFDSIWSLTGLSKDGWGRFTKDYKKVDFNIYTIKDKTIENRERTIGYCSRVALFKGSGRLLRQMVEALKTQPKIPYVYAGANYSIPRWFNKHTFGGDFNMLGILMKDGKLKDSYIPIVDYNLPPQIDKCSLYPRFTLQEQDLVYSKIGVAICPTLAREYSEHLKKDDSYIIKNQKYWEIGMEYSNYELIDYGIPVMFSRDYCNTYDKTMINEFPELIYDNIEDCLQYVQKNYNKLQESAYKQKEWLTKRVEQVNYNLGKMLEELVK